MLLHFPVLKPSSICLITAGINKPTGPSFAYLHDKYFAQFNLGRSRAYKSGCRKCTNGNNQVELPIWRLTSLNLHES